MTHIEQMIQDLCPNGVEFKKLGDLGVFENTGVDKKSHDDEQEVTLLNFMDVCRHKYIDASIPSMVVTAPDRKIEQCNVLKDDIFITPSSETIDEIGFAAVIMEDLPNVVYSYHIMRYRLKQPNTTTAKFIRYLFEAPVIRKQILKGAKGLTRFGLSKYQFADIEIPLPPIEIQKKIVECLDKFSALAAELQAELHLRRKQYEYYRTQLLTPHSDCNSADNTDDCNWEWKTLGEITLPAVNIKWKHVDATTEYQYVDLTSVNRENRNIEGTNIINKETAPSRAQQIIETGDILFGTTRPTLQRYCYVPKEYNGQICSTGYCVLRANKNVVLPKWIYYQLSLNSFIDYVTANQSGAAYPSISDSQVKAYKIPLPPLAEQERIVSILDKFEALTTSLSDGIPAEQAAQQKRYEYYRDLLLPFDRKAV